MTNPAVYGALPLGAVDAYVAPVQGVSKPLLLLSPTDSDAATMAAGTQVATLPVGNLQTIQPQKKWRSTATLDYVSVTFASPIAANALALVGHNLSGVAVIRVRGAILQANLTAAPDIDTGWQSAWPATGKPTIANWPNWLALLTWANTTATQYWRVDIADPGNTDGYLEAGRLVLGTSWQPTYNFDVQGSPIGFDSVDAQSKSALGFLFTSKAVNSPARLFNVAISGTNRREVFDGISEIQRLRSLWGDVICCLDPAETTDFHRFSMQGAFIQKPDYPIVPWFDSTGAQMFGAKIGLNELL